MPAHNGKKHSIRPRKTQSTLCLPEKKGHPEGALDKKRRCYYNKNRGKALAVDVVSSFPGLCQKIDRSVGQEQRRSIFFVFEIMLRFGSAPKDIPRNHPCHLNDTNDDGSQKVQYTENNI